ncbi:hypothetical protein FAES_1674 [Fibrella aestuarina BUZ 2]|uniref:DUF2264 domain-containing protein n=1 Tax=Fibrella aestuarina BUZ 2 TaxID=1166018 RepID=I0K6D1_9BACT|nr:DUF2264 domain-containing protein [Fibrella aestuarina]CCG99684.1 hypothetical protein FAES_1674 [Fibrella aestuarina BUZ 2]
MKRRIICLLLIGLCGLIGLTAPLQAQSKRNSRTRSGTAPNLTPTRTDRQYWLYEMDRMVRPVLQSLAHDSLRILMPKVVSKRVDNRDQRLQVQYVEVLGRVLSGMAPWLQAEGGAPDEVALRNQYRQWVLKGLSNALDSTARDYMRFDIAGQSLVDASFLALAVVRAPWLWDHLSATDRDRLVTAIRSTRKFKPGFSNWLLFSAMNEAFFCRFGYDWDPMRVDYALQQMEQWYVGDGMYTDGPRYAFDYYNSYVIHPYLAAITGIIGTKTNAYAAMTDKIRRRNERYAVIQERLINTDGSFPATGRSIVYRGAAFHHLADIAWRKSLPTSLKPAQVRGALTAVLRKTLESPTTYQNGWLTIGLYGAQPDIADVYNNQGSLYLATSLFLPLGLPATDPFWADPPQPWSAQAIWSGSDFPNDHGEDLR